MRQLTLKIASLLFATIPRLAYPVLSGPLKGTRFIFGAPAGECGGASVFINKAEPEQLAVFADTLKPNQVFFDVGANVGLYSMLGSRQVGPQGRVIAIEPDARNVTFLYRHMVANKATNITIIPAACSRQIGILFFTQGENCATGHLEESCTSTGTIPVLSISIDEFALKTNIYPDVIKIDVEGAEMDVLRGAANVLKKHKPKIFLSTHSNDLRTSCLDYLSNLGYQINPLGRHADNASEFIAT